MLDKLKTYLEKRMPISDDLFEKIAALFIQRRLKKGDFLQQAGDVSKYGFFVASGCLRSYVIDNKGKEHIVQFATDDWWMSDMKSLTTGQPSLYFMDAIENSDVLFIDVPSFKKLTDLVPDFNKAYQAGVQKNTQAKDQRIIASLSASAEERYLEFIKTYPTIVSRVPQHMVASYLGISPETLSRVRRSIVKK
jgi:CRP-like cAMP-binding protein